MNAGLRSAALKVGVADGASLRLVSWRSELGALLLKYVERWKDDRERSRDQ